MKPNETLKAGFFASLAVVLVKLGGEALGTPGIGFKILGVVFVLLGTISAGVVLYLLGVYD